MLHLIAHGYVLNALGKGKFEEGCFPFLLFPFTLNSQIRLSFTMPTKILNCTELKEQVR